MSRECDVQVTASLTAPWIGGFMRKWIDGVDCGCGVIVEQTLRALDGEGGGRYWNHAERRTTNAES
jgi:hypothetical protein